VPFDLTPDEKIVLWRKRAAELRAIAADANTDQERDACFTVAASYDALIKSEEQLIAQRLRGIIRDYLGGC
jgi:hypothetical protein